MSSLDWNPDAACWVKGRPYVTEGTLSRHTGWDEHPVPVNLSALSNDPLDDIWDGRAYFASVQLYGTPSDKVNAPEPIPITCISDLSSSVGTNRREKLTVWWGKMWLSTAAQAACCFEASISEVTTNTGGISTTYPNLASEGQCSAIAIRRMDTYPHQEPALPCPRQENS